MNSLRRNNSQHKIRAAITVLALALLCVFNAQWSYAAEPATPQNTGSRDIENSGTLFYRSSNNQRANQPSNQVTMAFNNGPLSVTKTVDKATAERGETLTYNILTENTEPTALSGINVTIDSVAQQAFIVRDQLPANTRYQSATASNSTGDSRLLYHVVGEPIHSYVSQLPDLTQIDAIAAASTQLDGNATLNLQLLVTINDNAGGTLSNTAEAHSNEAQAESTEVQTTLSAPPGKVQFFRRDNNNGNAKPLSRSSTGNDVFISADAAACNTQSDVIEQYELLVTTRLSEDSETFTAVETGPNTGVFEVKQAVPLRSTEQVSVEHNNEEIEADKNDELLAEFLDCDARIEDGAMLIDPLGIVFDAISNLPVAGAVVTLIDVDGSGNGGNPGGPARVFADDGTTPAPSTVTTGNDGAYQFPRVAPSRYRLQVTPPADYQFPSQVPPEELSSDRIIDADGSYGREFIVSEETGARTIDVPLDLISSRLFVAITLNQTTVQPADVVRADITVSNRSDRDTDDTTLNITPPPGFRIIPGSVRFNGVALPEFDGSVGVGTLPANSDIVITVQLEALASATTGTVTVNANGTTVINSQNVAITSNTASQRVRVLNVLGESYVIGTVYLDCDGDFRQGSSEPGIPGVRLYLEDGSYVITDSAGRYSVYGLRTGSHVIKLDATTLPADTTPKPIDFRHAGDGSSRFIDLKAGELHKANFTFFCTDAARQSVQRRLQRAEELAENLRSAADQPLSAIDELTLSPQKQATADTRKRTSVLGSNRDATANRALSRNSSFESGTTESPSPFTDVPASFDVKAWFAGQNKKLAFIDLKNGDLLALNKITVRVKANSRATLQLLLNGSKVDSNKIGQRASDKSTGVGYVEYVAVDLQPGDNTLRAEVVDSFGNVREKTEITIQRPGPAVKLALQVNKQQLIANGSDPLEITLQAKDENGLPANLNAPITLQTTAGLWASEDIDPTTPGLQVMAKQGRASVRLLPPSSPQKGQLEASIGLLETEQTLAFRAELRPMIAVGLVEGIISFGRSTPMQQDRESQLFEQELTALTDSADNGSVRYGGRGALFMKGRIHGNALLTVRYDSENNNQDQLFRDIEPQRNYPIYGDAAQRGFDARSTSALYARVERDNNYVQYGDLISDADSDTVKLGNVRRSLTGVQAHVENERSSATVFASRDSSEQQIDEIPAEGVSGPYKLNNTAIRSGSETVELITRDRDQPAVIIQTVSQIRFTDYVLDPLSGELVFRRPINSVDRDLNPVSIRVRYEVNSGGESFWVGGVQADVKVNERLSVGGGWVRDNNPNSDRSRDVQNIHGKYVFGKSTRLEAEIARSDDGDSNGMGWRLALQHRGEKLDVVADLGRVDADFNNPSAAIRAGREEARIRSRYKLNERQSIQVEALHSKDLADDGERRNGLAISGRHELEKGALELGVRHTRRSQQDEETNVTSIRGRAESRLPFIAREHKFFIEAEQDINNSKRRLLAVGGNVELHPKTQLYTRHEVSSSETGAFGLEERNNRHSTVVGVTSEYFDNGQLFSEYRARDSISGREAEAAIGLRNQWALNDHTSINVAAERVSPLGGDDSKTRTALGFGLQFADSKRHSGSARLEWRETESGYSWYNTLGLATRLSESFSLLGRNTLSIRSGSESVVEDRLQLGVAWRDSNSDTLHALARYEWRLRDNNSSRQQAQLWTTHVNWQPRRDVQLSGSYGIRHVNTDDNSGDGFNSNTDAQAVFGRINWRAFERVDIGLQAGVLGSNSFGDRVYGSGVELGYLLHSNLWLAAGFNFTGVNDDDFGGENARQGSYLRLRFKFDENLFGVQQ